MALPVFLVIFGDFSMNTLLELTEFELFEECKIETLTAEVLNILDYCDYLASRAVSNPRLTAGYQQAEKLTVYRILTSRLDNAGFARHPKMCKRLFGEYDVNTVTLLLSR